MQTIWKGAVSFGLVNVPVKMFTATQDNDLPMRMLHKEKNVPIQYHRTCPKCEEEVKWSDIVKGYEYEPGHFVTFDKEELEEIASETSREIRIVDFVDLEEIDPIYYQKTYYLAPESNGTHAYNLLVQALLDTRKIGIANVSIRSRSSLAAIRIVDGVLSMSTMFYAEEIRSKKEIPNLPEESKADERELAMARMLIEQLSAKFEPEKYEDVYKERLMDAIEDKVKGKEVKFAPEEKKTNVIDLMEALRASLKQPGPAKAGADEATGKDKPDKTETKKPARKKSAAKTSKDAAKPKSGKADKSEAPASKARTKKTGS
ncbi:Ku protein [Cohnella sp. JJ-181]|uniref:non-homologous end joining protein Ku n=1 Tax=Cohnella rhizoplanae TaxID=2974897 RepID=UPI0022FF79ED|nr:Ku protein [Cohnella sp. JJ-181]CAI6031854.1 Non-homologous end joining protein Ku [Cohnella sp. JJ-181]